MTFKYSKYGLVFALISLIPIFPIFTLFPMISISMGLEAIFSNCETGYKITFWFSLITAIVVTYVYIKKVIKRINTDYKNSKNDFISYSIIIYSLINTLGLIAIVGPESACYGDGQSVLACIYSGPIASFVILLIGILIDMLVKKSKMNK